MFILGYKGIESKYSKTDSFYNDLSLFLTHSVVEKFKMKWLYLRMIEK